MGRSRWRRGSRQAREEHRYGDLSDGLITVCDPTSLASEAYRTLRTNLLYGPVDAPPKVVVLSGPTSGVGKTTVCANLGIVLAQVDKKVLILDCDLRKPTVHKIFDLKNTLGLVNVLAGERRIEEIMQAPQAGLKVVTAGPTPPNPTELLDSQSFAQFLNQVRGEFDHVLIDAPPVSIVSDPLILGRQGDGVLLVIDTEHAQKKAVRKAIHHLRNVGANILGMIMNKTQSHGSGHYYNYV